MYEKSELKTENLKGFLDVPSSCVFNLNYIMSDTSSLDSRRKCHIVGTVSLASDYATFSSKLESGFVLTLKLTEIKINSHTDTHH